LGELPIAAVPLVVAIEPDARFRDWLHARLDAVAEARHERE
jgi:hypothetical protein